jgi:cytochrome c
MKASKLAFILGIVLISSCVKKHEKAFNRAQQPWAIRSVLDYKPRMLTLALDSAMFVAYDLQGCTFYKAWRGGVNWDGIVYNDTKVIQPTTWGKTYDQDTHPQPWSMEVEGRMIKPKVQFTGYRFSNNQIYLNYTLSFEGDTVFIEESPEFIRGSDHKPGIQRTFNRSGSSKVGVQLITQFKALDIRQTTTVLTKFFDEIPLQIQPSLPVRTDDRGRYFLQKSDCFSCHEWEENTVGPAFKTIAERYTASDEVVDYLIQRIREGGSGVWGNTSSMNPHPGLEDEDLRLMVNFILSLNQNQDTRKNRQAPLKIPERIVKPPGFGAPLEGVHPSYDLRNLEPAGIDLTVGGMAFFPDGRLLVTTWSPDGSVYILDGVQTGDSSQVVIKRIAQGLMEPLGAEVVDDAIYVMQKHELTQLIDHDGDEVIDEYKAICNSFGVSTDFHEFALGLIYRDGFFYSNLSIPMRLMANELPLPDRGRTVKIALDGSFEHLNHGLRQPNGIGFGAEGDIFVTDNQGQWLPANKFIHVKEGAFHGMRWVLPDSLKDIPEEPPTIWLPQDEIANSPSEPTTINLGPYQNQMLYGDISHGGIKRVYLEEVNGAYQGVVFRFTQGLQAGVNRLRWGPDGALYVGEAGMVGGWSWRGKRHGLQRLSYNEKPTFEMLTVKALNNGFRIAFTEPLAAGHGESAQDYLLQQWWYQPTASYGGPKIDLERLSIKAVTVSDDRRSVDLEIPGLKEGRVVYFLLNDKMQSSGKRPLWSGECWYTLNHIPKTML